MTSHPPAPYRTPVAFDEADSEGIVFFGNYFRFAHRALEHYLPQIGISWADWFDHPEHGVPLRHVEADYLAPLRPGETLEVQVQVAKVGQSSVEFSYEMRGPHGPASQLRTVHVFVSRQTRMKIEVPLAIQQKLNLQAGR